MPPKEKPRSSLLYFFNFANPLTLFSKKAVKEKQSRAIDEATFGLKNKNKSKKVQQFIDRVEKNVKHNPDVVCANQMTHEFIKFFLIAESKGS